MDISTEEFAARMVQVMEDLQLRERITPAQLKVFFLIATQEEASQIQLAKDVGMSVASISRTLRDLCTDRLLKMDEALDRAHRDVRYQYTISKEGTALINKLKRILYSP